MANGTITEAGNKTEHSPFLSSVLLLLVHRDFQLKCCLRQPLMQSLVNQLGPGLEPYCHCQRPLGKGLAGHKRQRISQCYHDIETMRQEDEWLHLAEVKAEMYHLLHLRWSESADCHLEIVQERGQ